MNKKGYIDNPTVGVWSVLWNESTIADEKSLLDLLDSHEQHRYWQIKSHMKRSEYLLAHVLLRVALSHRWQVDLQQWRYGRIKSSKPFIVEPAACSQVDFSLSHTTGMAACAVGWGVTIGVDVESMKKDFDPCSVACNFMSPWEYERWLNMPAGPALERFYATWTLKEAYAKAIGRGIGLPMRDLSISLELTTSNDGATWHQLSSSGNGWQIATLRPAPEYWLGLAVQSDRARIPVMTCNHLSVNDLFSLLENLSN